MLMMLSVFLILNFIAFAGANLCDGTTTSLDLSGQGLTVLPDLSMCTALTRLFLYNNELTVLPTWITQLVNLQSLTVSFNRLAAFPSEICQLVNLQELDLNGNQMTTLPTEIGQLVNLQNLGVTLNQLTALPAEFGQLVSLVGLDINSNLITTFPEPITQLGAHITFLDFHNNQLTSLPAEVGELVNLQVFLLYGNQLTTLPNEFALLTALSSVNLAGNPIVCLPEVVRNHAGWNLDLSSYSMCSNATPTVRPTTIPTTSYQPSEHPSAAPNANRTANTFHSAEPTPTKSKLPPIVELYKRANTPAIQRQQSATSAGSSRAGRNTQSGDDVKAKINKMRAKAAGMRGEL
jgi:Leucine-rich repeat (LRR) protein